ncbi:MAG: hypothetical protein WC807_01875 [Hyphomicrobium sp.]
MKVLLLVPDSDRKTSYVRVAGRFHSQAIIEELRYWVPTVKDVARVYEIDEPEGWRLFIIPATDGACPVELLLRNDGLFDIEIGGQKYEAQSLTARNMLVVMLQQIADGRVLQRRWSSQATGAPCGLETIVDMGDGTLWTARQPPHGIAEENIEGLCRHFLPYRR